MNRDAILTAQTRKTAVGSQGPFSLERASAFFGSGWPGSGTSVCLFCNGSYIAERNSRAFLVLIQLPTRSPSWHGYEKLPVVNKSHRELQAAKTQPYAHGGSEPSGEQHGAVSAPLLWQRVLATLPDGGRRHELCQRVAPP
ncbi:hypothetical protein HPB48_006074 [Haemaphysalis longicornis]|uniref:Uncharacterized protein n=1 Tax=Haemaphysalis longicornis TaxID=44386 RepID=A0A9J6GA14_HAELO|nr:hypothetical protein HPB48_006074 [Haemaphysalis longicornis]